MTQHAEQQTPQQEVQRRVYGRPFLPGQSGNPRGSESASARRERFERKVAEIVAEYGGQLSPTEIDLVRSAAELLMRRPVDVDQQVRIANAVTRIYARLAKRKRKPDGPSVNTTMSTLEAIKRHARG
jgi:hypothetical protein